MKHYMNRATGLVDTEKGWAESYEATELEERGLTAQQAFAEDCKTFLIEVEKDSDKFWG